MNRIVSKIAILIIVVCLCLPLAACTDFSDIKGVDGQNGRSAYQIWLDNGFSGTEIDFLNWLSTNEDANSGKDGKSAYQIWLDNGYTGTESDFLNWLKGANGQNVQIDIYQIYNAYLTTYPNASFEEFLEKFMLTGYNGTEYAIAKGIQSVVSIYSTFTRNTNRPGQSSEFSAGGAGIIYKIQGGYAYIITNYHMVYDRSSNAVNGIAKKIEVYTYGHESTTNTITAEFVGGSITQDIAVIKVALSEFSDNIQAVQVADSNQLSLGELVVAIGNAAARGISATSGIISVDSEEIQMEALDSATKSILLRVIRTDAPINQGNSGGGLFNAHGELIGIVNAKTIQSGVENIGYAIPINVAAGIADCVIENDSKKCLLGIEISAASTSMQYNTAQGRIEITEAIYVDNVTSNSLATGKLQKGDKLISAKLNNGDSIMITRLFHLSDFLYKARPNDMLKLEIERNGALITVEIVLTSSGFNQV